MCHIDICHLSKTFTFQPSLAYSFLGAACRLPGLCTNVWSQYKTIYHDSGPSETGTNSWRISSTLSADRLVCCGHSTASDANCGPDIYHLSTTQTQHKTWSANTIWHWLIWLIRDLIHHYRNESYLFSDNHLHQCWQSLSKQVKETSKNISQTQNKLISR